ncbi:MAG: hypothetical protein ABI867_38760 [Kofleriaceae bacterium]
MPLLVSLLVAAPAAADVAVVVPKASEPHEYFTRQLRINDFSLERYQTASCSEAPDCHGLVWIHPYFLQQGANAVSLDYWANTLDSTPGAEYEIVFRFQGGAKPKLGPTLATLKTPKFGKLDEDHKQNLRGSVTVTDKLPAWTWTRGVKIENTPANRASLYVEYTRVWTALAKGDRAKLHAELRTSTKEYLEASRLAKQTDGLDRMIALANNPRDKNKTPLHLRDMPELDGLTMQLFAGGRLAKLVNYYAIMIRFQGGAHDAPSGHAGPVDIGYDLWFRKDARGRWVVDAVAPADDHND